MSKFIFSVLVLSLTFQAQAADKIKVLTTLPDLAEVVRGIAGDKAEVESLLSGTEDAHFLDAVPSFIRKAANADIVCVVGLELEVGWMPKVLAKTGKAKIQPGGIGYCDVGKGIATIEKPSAPVDRSMGDVHPFGNPHYNLSPMDLADGAKIVAEALSQARPEYAAEFQANLKKFRSQMEDLKKNISAKLQPAVARSKESALLIEYHREFSYFFYAYGLKSAGAIEEKPGVPPSAARLGEVSKGAKAAHVRLAMAAYSAPEKQLQKFTELSGVPYKKLPNMVSRDDQKTNSIEKVQNALADAIVQSL